jgi:hypothetical protein
LAFQQTQARQLAFQQLQVQELHVLQRTHAEQLAAMQASTSQALIVANKAEIKAANEATTAKATVTQAVEPDHKTSKDDAKLIQLHSSRCHLPSKGMQEKLLKQMELMAVTLDERKKTAKELGRSGAKMIMGMKSHTKRDRAEPKGEESRDWFRS